MINEKITLTGKGNNPILLELSNKKEQKRIKLNVIKKNNHLPESNPKVTKNNEEQTQPAPNPVNDPQTERPGTTSPDNNSFTVKATDNTDLTTDRTPKHFFIYLDLDLAPKWKASQVTSIAYNQSPGWGIGCEYSDVLIQNIHYVFGGKYQLDRQIDAAGKPKYHSHTIYTQGLTELIQGRLLAGIELNYSIHGGNDYYSNGASFSGDWGYGLVLAYKEDHWQYKTGYRVIKSRANANNTNIQIESSGIYAQAGIIF